MRTIAAVVFVLALGVSFAIVANSGVGVAIFGQDHEDRGGLGPMENLNETGDDVNVSEGEDGSISGDVAGEDEQNIVGFIIDGASFIVGVVASVTLLPLVLIGLGFPTYFALPIGIFVQFVAVVGAVQFATNRTWQ